MSIYSLKEIPATMLSTPEEGVKYSEAVARLNRAVRPTSGPSLNWSEIVERFKPDTVQHGFNFGNVLALEIQGHYFGFFDGANNCYAWSSFTFDGFSEFLTEIKTDHK